MTAGVVEGTRKLTVINCNAYHLSVTFGSGPAAIGLAFGAGGNSTQATRTIMMKLRTTILALLTATCLPGALMAQAFTDTFDADHDYASGDVTGTIWDGFFYNLYGGDATVAAADANISNPGVLTLRSTFGNWENGDDDGILLYKTIAGNFDVSVQVVSMNNPNWHDAGLMARVANLEDAGAGEDYVAARYFAAFNINALRSTDDGATSNTETPTPAQPWIRLKRNGDVFTMYRGTNGVDWAVVGSVTRSDLSGLPLQVGLWQATFSGNEGIAQFDNFSLTPLLGPTITASPESSRVVAGGSVTFSVTAVGIEPLEYQWRHDGEDIPGATEATLTLTNLEVADAGAYTVVVTDADGASESDAAILTVPAVPGVFDTSHDFLADGTAGTFWDGFFFNVAGGDTTVATADANLTNPGQLTLRSTFGNWENGDDDGLLLYKNVTGNFDARIQVISMNTPNWHDAGLMARVADLADAGAGEDWVSVKYFANGNSNSHRTTDNGASSTTTAPGSAQPWLRLKRVGDTFTSYRSTDDTNWTMIDATTRSDLSGLPVQVGIFQATFSANEGIAQFAEFSLTLLAGPTITVQPRPAKALVDSSASFSVAATGIEPLEYQWQHDGTNLPGATEATLTLMDVQLADAGEYMVVVSDADGSTESETALLTVATLPGFFDTSHDFLADGVTGTFWDGFFYNVAGGDATVPAADANITYPGRLTLRSVNGNWEFGDDDGVLLYKTVAGDFDARVKVASMNKPNWHDAGLMARVADLAEAGAGEDWVAMKYFAFGNNNGFRNTDDGGSITTNSVDAAQPWLRLTRVGDRFTGYRSTDGTNWTEFGGSTRSDLTGLPVQVGIFQATFSVNEGIAQFEDFSLAAGSLSVVPGVGEITISWPGEGFILQHNPDLNDPNGWSDVPDVTGTSATLPAGSGNEFFRVRLDSASRTNPARRED